MSRKVHKEVLYIKNSDGEEVACVAPSDLAEWLGDLRYDSLAVYLSALAEKLQKDSESDGGRGRGKLAEHLQRTSWYLDEAVYHVKEAWDICEPYMSYEVVSESAEEEGDL